MHLFVRAYSISDSQLLRNCFVVCEWLSWLLFRPFCHPRAFFLVFCLLGDRMGTGRGNQEVLSEQRQNRGNLDPFSPHPTPPLQPSLSLTNTITALHVSAALLTEHALISFGCWVKILPGLIEVVCTKTAISNLQIKSCFSRSGERAKKKENAHKTASG